ncbi:MAG: S9 family peptidase [Proteobacteria bacterium]|nr:S9 family peptidase [Pseudomonadota bacterium]
MKRLVTTLALASTLVGAAWTTPLPYPSAPSAPQVDVIHGVKVADPYRPLEDPDSPATQRWIAAENGVTRAFLDAVPQRDAIKARLTKLWNFERFDVPWKEGGRYFWFHNDGLQNQSVLFTASSLTDAPRVLLDPNTLSKDGTTALNTWSVSLDGRHLAYALSVAGSDWTEFHVRNVDDGRDLADTLRWVKFSGASWAADGSGFFYSRYDAPKEGAKALREANYYQKLYFHRLGTPQDADVLVYDRPDQKEWGFSGEATRDGRFLIITVTHGTERKNRIFVLDLAAHPIPKEGRVDRACVTPLFDQADAAYDFIDSDGERFWFSTTWKAPRGAVFHIDVKHPQAADRTVVIPESRDTIEAVSLVGHRLVVQYMQDAHAAVRSFTPDGRDAKPLALPGLGTVGGFGGHRDDAETFYMYTSFTTPRTIYRYDVATGASSLFRRPKVDFDARRYETKLSFYTSRDGTRVPIYVTARRGLRRDGANPVLLYGYGGFNIPIQPAFSVGNLVWMEMGGVYAVANIRGGGEYGEAWHQAGTKHRKQNVFDDFIAAAEWLVKERYTSPKRLAILGRSNGGLLVGAAITQRPDLFGAAIPGVGVLDMLRFHKFTIGWAWTSDYGSPDNADDFKALLRYSPLHNIRKGARYPATLIITADHDDRVVPAHSFKFAAALQAAQGAGAPVLIRIETRAGHGAGKPVTKVIDEVTDQWAFLVRTLGMTPTI